MSSYKSIFVNIIETDENNVIKSIETNTQALEEYNSTHPDIQQETITQEDRIKALEAAMLNMMEVNNDV